MPVEIISSNMNLPMMSTVNVHSMPFKNQRDRCLENGKLSLESSKFYVLLSFSLCESS